MSTNLSVRLDDRSVENLDKLVVAVRAYYERQAEVLPVCAQLAKETTRSSALRDLLLAWAHGSADSMFSRDLTGAISDE